MIHILSKPNLMTCFNKSSIGSTPYFVSCKFYTSPFFSYVEIPLCCCQSLHNIQRMGIRLFETYYRILLTILLLKIHEKNCIDFFFIHLIHPSATFSSMSYALLHLDCKESYRASSFLALHTTH